MPKCPACKREIDYLIGEREVTEFFEVRLDSYGNFDCSDSDIEANPLGEGIRYRCSECGTMIFDEPQEALAFLKG